MIGLTCQFRMRALPFLYFFYARLPPRSNTVPESYIVVIVRYKKLMMKNIWVLNFRGNSYRHNNSGEIRTSLFLVFLSDAESSWDDNNLVVGPTTTGPH